MYFYLVLFTNSNNSFSLIDWIDNKTIKTIEFDKVIKIQDFQIAKLNNKHIYN